jgi:hypothetical protein
MGRLGRVLIGAVAASLLLQGAASAAPHAASENWVGTWGYVALRSASTANAFRGWPDRLAERLATQHWAVVNAGIGGNRLLRYGLGPSALSRLDRDVLSVPGLKVMGDSIDPSLLLK